MIEKILDNKLLFIGIHLFLGFLVTFLPIAKIYAIFIFIIGTLIIYTTKNKNEEALFVASYLVGAEVFIRMSGGTLLYEAGKYGVIIFALLLPSCVWRKYYENEPRNVFSCIRHFNSARKCCGCSWKHDFAVQCFHTKLLFIDLVTGNSASASEHPVYNG